MKKIMTFLQVVIPLTIVTSFGAIDQNPEQLIIGTWKPEGCATCKWVFKEDGKCYDHYKGKIFQTYRFSIKSGKSLNGKLTHHFLTLTDISNPKESYEYEINGLSEKRMALEYLKGTRKLQYFTRE
ncbi:hypothetical protein [Ekhidna sp.]